MCVVCEVEDRGEEGRRWVLLFMVVGGCKREHEAWWWWFDEVFFLSWWMGIVEGDWWWAPHVDVYGGKEWWREMVVKSGEMKKWCSPFFSQPLFSLKFFFSKLSFFFLFQNSTSLLYWSLLSFFFSKSWVPPLSKFLSAPHASCGKNIYRNWRRQRLWNNAKILKEFNNAIARNWPAIHCP